MKQIAGAYIKVPKSMRDIEYTELLNSFDFIKVDISKDASILYSSNDVGICSCTDSDEVSVFEFDVFEYETEKQNFVYEYRKELVELEMYLDIIIDVKFGVFNV